ncbi:unnamed protein product, partial [Lymnaea stagnalis]
QVLPGDKSGLPWEIWQIILAWLSAGDLCHVACVCKTWTELVVSVDSSRWKELYMKCSEWRHPFWPLNVDAEPPSWRLAYRDQYMATKFWRIRQHQDAKQSSCTAIFKKPVPNKNIHVGPGMGHDSLNAALSVANAYDRIIMHPGIYDEQYEVVAKIPFELVGHGELGSVILVVGIQQLASTTRLSNLVLRAPWFTSFIVMINSGYLQIDNCIIENGIICLQSPSTVHIKFCTFRHTTVILQNMNASIIENCEFSQSSSANIIIEGHPKEYKSWTYSFLRDRTYAIYQQNRSLHRKKSQSDEILSDSSSEDDLSTLNELEDSALEASDGDDAQDDLSSTSSDSSQANSLNYSNSEDNLSSSEDSVIMLPHLQEMHADQSDLASLDMKAEVESINSECQVQGCLIHQCRMNHSKGGVVISLQAHAIISECDISNVGYGIRCIQNARVVILKNKIHHCRTSGIFMRLAASGLVAGNDIHSNNEAGIDIRKSADPLVQYNQIHHGKRSGVVVLGSGRGRIKKNDIYCNAEAGVYVLFGGNPTISENYIYEGRAAGVAINAGGKGCVIDNVIRANKWGGIDIRNGSCPLISGNTITNGVSDGIVVGTGGRGIIENNFISGNAGCGMWLLTARDLYIHGNQICNSGHCGIMLVDMNVS